MDMNDRSLRKMVIGLGGKSEGVPREARFDITAASEVMAILGLSSDLRDLEARCARIVIGRAPDGKPVRAGDLSAQAAMTALLRDALMPNLVQTREGGPALVHGGPFGNIAHGCSSIVATRMALQYADEVITEGGFGFDLGGEKFLDIKCRAAGLWPRAVVLVATLRALKYHGGVPLAAVAQPDLAGLQRGFDHLDKHLESLAGYGLPVVVAINRFPNDVDSEIEALRSFARERGVVVAAHEGFGKGGDGSLELADAVRDVLDRTDAQPPKPKFLYELQTPPEEKIRTIAKRIYGADDVIFTSAARKQIETIVGMGEGNLPICMAKTHLSLTDDATRVGRPRGFKVTVREVRLSAGAGYIVPLTGEIMTMPGLPKEPASRKVVMHDDGRITGLMQGE
jgi:formate--tetrahydrofolate ligase